MRTTFLAFGSAVFALTLAGCFEADPADGDTNADESGSETEVGQTEDSSGETESGDDSMTDETTDESTDDETTDGETTDDESTESTDDTTEETTDDDGCDGEIDECGVCNGPGGPCLGCTVPAATNYDPLAEVEDGSCICIPTGGAAMDQVQLADFPQSSLGVGSQWQSFTPGLHGGLRAVEIEVFQTNGPIQADLNVYLGEGVNGQMLASVQVPIPNNDYGMHQFDFQQPVAVELGQTYTFELDMPGQNDIHFGINQDNPYPGGRSGFAADVDLRFRTHVGDCEQE